MQALWQVYACFMKNYEDFMHYPPNFMQSSKKSSFYAVFMLILCKFMQFIYALYAPGILLMLPVRPLTVTV
jgi:hypothetical protein